MRDTSDADLLILFGKGDEQAFNELVRRHQTRVYWVARRVLGSHEEADDVVQEVFVKAYESLSTFRGDASLSTWLYRIAMNLSLNALRKKRLRSMLHLDELSEEPASRAGATDAPLLREEQDEALRRAVESLPAKQKQVFILRYYEELSYAEIARILKRSEGGLKANYFHAVQKIQAALKRNEP
jgi:RNA polymerase sigma-70 factor (ECF subfamily)